MAEDIDGATPGFSETSLEATFMSQRFARVTLKALQVGRRIGRTDDGQDLLEYGLLASLIALIAFGAVASVGNAIHTVFWTTIAGAVPV